MDVALKPVLWAASSKKDLMNMPPEVQSDFGYGLWEAQVGEFPGIGKVLSGFGSANIVELRLNAEEGTFRAVYTLQFEEVVIVLHVFQKKSNKGKETPKQDRELIHSRLKIAELMFKEWKAKRGKK